MFKRTPPTASSFRKFPINQHNEFPFILKFVYQCYSQLNLLTKSLVSISNILNHYIKLFDVEHFYNRDLHSPVHHST